jgi:dTDP-4-dehydrorhamnose 3,5-epimerase
VEEVVTTRSVDKVDGVALTMLNRVQDARGAFVKTFHIDTQHDFLAIEEIREEYYSVSHDRVFRGMHLQVPPADHVKYVLCMQGIIRDYILDLRPDSPTFLGIQTIELNGQSPQIVRIPKGCAHGFLTCADNTIVRYQVTSAYAPESDTGVSADSLGVETADWILSERDRKLPSLSEFLRAYSP